MLEVRVNNGDIFELVNFTTDGFTADQALYIYNSDFESISQAFENISIIEVFRDGLILGKYNAFNSFSEITYIKDIFDTQRNMFVSAMRVALTKLDLTEQVQRIDEQINPVYDTDAMTLAEAKEFKIKQIGSQCREDIYSGDQVILSDGTVKTYTYNDDDQRNLTNAAVLGFVGKMMGFDLDYIPYHASNMLCELMPTEDIVAVYMTLQLKLTRLVTKCNMLNCMIHDMVDKDSVLAVTWDTELPQEYQVQYEAIVAASLAIANAMAEAMQPTIPEDTPEGTDEDTPEEQPEGETTE